MRTAIVTFLITGALILASPMLLTCKSNPMGKKGMVQRRGDFLDLTVRLPVPWLFSGSKPQPNKVVYLNREGASLQGGGDDATTNRATLAGPTKKHWIHVPAFRGSYLRWQAIFQCVRKAYAPFDVKIVDQRPVDKNYMMVLLGGHPKLLTHKKGKAHLKATGMAPHNGLPIPNAVVIVFSRFMKESTRRSCETAVHEIAHAYGLDHGYHCRDFMTYLPYCGSKRFVDKAVPCGERKKRKCHGDKSTQNSYRELVKVLGLRKKK